MRSAKFNKSLSATSGDIGIPARWIISLSWSIQWIRLVINHKYVTGLGFAGDIKNRQTVNIFQFK